MSKSIKIATISAIGFAAIFSVFSIVFYFGDWPRLLMVSFIGFFVGVMAAPEFEPKAFKNAWLLQSCSGACAGLAFGVFFHLEASLIVACMIIGFVVGWLAPSWLKHVQAP